jgi:polyhydroxyalkanoate synthesis repressor PhaR
LDGCRVGFLALQPEGGATVADTARPLLIKRYASRRLYNTETSDYVTLDDIAAFIREGREVQIVDLKSGEDLTRQYLLQIISEHESRGESVLPVDVLTDLVRSYSSQAASVVPQFLAASFEMLRQSQAAMMDNMQKVSPVAKLPGFDALRAQQEAFFKAMSSFMAAVPGAAPPEAPRQEGARGGEDLEAIKAQLAELQSRVAKLGK